MKRGPDFTAVLVRDVSRWSRAENTDEAGFYEFICRTNGVQVLYVDETFGPEQSPYALLMKSVKRAMAAEFSLEKARNVRSSQARLVRLGFWPTGSVPHLESTGLKGTYDSAKFEGAGRRARWS